MNADASLSSLLSFLDAPIVVGDPEGRVIYVNPAFQRAFSRSSEEVCGESLASVFGGGGREAILRAVAEVCSRGETVNFRLKEANAGYLGLASPIEAEQDRVGVVILLTEEPAADERLLAYHGEISEPLDEALQSLEEILEQTGGRRSEQYRGMVERGISALERARKWSEELHAALRGRGVGNSSSASLDPVKVVHQVVSRLVENFDRAGVSLQLLAPAQLRAASGHAAMLETALVRLIRHRLAETPSGGFITLSARTMGEGDGQLLLFCVVDEPELEPEALDLGRESDAEPRVVRAAVEALGGQVCTIADPGLGRVTAIRLEPAAAS